jgi:hypothetical protein
VDFLFARLKLVPYWYISHSISTLLTVDFGDWQINVDSSANLLQLFTSLGSEGCDIVQVLCIICAFGRRLIRSYCFFSQVLVPEVALDSCCLSEHGTFNVGRSNLDSAILDG